MAVVVAVDGSAGSSSAIRLAEQEARWRAVPLLAVSAYRTDSTAGAQAGRRISTLRTQDDDRAVAASALRDAVTAALGDESERAGLRVVPGLAGRAIVSVAESEQAELIVLAARPGPSHFPGTVGQYVLRNAQCPVLIVPAGQRTTARLGA